MKYLFALLSTFFIYTACFSQVYQEYLLSGWEFKPVDSVSWLRAEVPGSIQHDLETNNQNIQQATVGDWHYRTVFNADPYIFSRDQIELLFKGIDTRANVYLNKQLILEADNMFRSWRVPIKPIVKEGANELEIRFYTDSVRSNTSLRKAAYHFDKSDTAGVPSGIWQPVILQSWDDYILRDVSIKPAGITEREAVIEAMLHIQAAVGTLLEVKLTDEVRDRVLHKDLIKIENTDQHIPVRFQLRRPDLWVPRAGGLPAMYQIGVHVKLKSNEQSLLRRVGLRDVQVNSSIDFNDSPSIQINGETLALKGINYTPNSLLTSNISSTDYDRFFENLKNRGINVVRVSGEGIYESDYFYDLADLHGILIIQDFMFVGKQYPNTERFIKNVRLEAKEVINRLKGHPAIIVWSLPAEVSIQGNSKLVEELGSTSKAYDPDRPFFESLDTSSWESIRGL